MARRQGLEQLGRRAQAHGHARALLEVDLQALERQVDLDHAADPLALHEHDFADVEDEQALEAGDLVPQAGGIVGVLAQADELEGRTEVGAAAPERFQGGDDLLLEAARTHGQRPGAAQQFEPDGPEVAPGELGVVELEQRAGALVLAGRGQPLGDAEEPVEVRRLALDVIEPVLVEAREAPEDRYSSNVRCVIAPG